MTKVEAFRDFYARYVTAQGGCRDPRIQAAFAAVERERYVGPGPWKVPTETGYISTGTSDPAILYQDILVGLNADRSINNGEPSLHACCLDAAAISPGAVVTHIGSGTGYYTALLAHLVGDEGRVTAYEIDPELGSQARVNLSHLKQVRVIEESGTRGALPKSDLIYVSAGATHPLHSWLEALNLGGRLIFPLTPNRGLGGMLRVTRLGADTFAAKFISPATFIDCIGARDEATGESLVAVFESRTTAAVKSLRWNVPADQSAWFVGVDWWLSTAEARDFAT